MLNLGKKPVLIFEDSLRIVRFTPSSWDKDFFYLKEDEYEIYNKEGGYCPKIGRLNILKDSCYVVFKKKVCNV